MVRTQPRAESAGLPSHPGRGAPVTGGGLGRVLSGGRDTMTRVSGSGLPRLRLVIGDEELLVSRAVTDTIAAARADDPDTEVHRRPGGELLAGELAELL